MSETLYRARKLVLDHGSIDVNLKVKVLPHIIVNWDIVWFELIDPYDDTPLTYSKLPHRPAELYTKIADHDISYGSFSQREGFAPRTIPGWIMEEAIIHFTYKSQASLQLRPKGPITATFEGFLGEDFGFECTGLEGTQIHLAAPGGCTAMQTFHWSTFFKWNDPRYQEIESLFATAGTARKK